MCLFIEMGCEANLSTHVEMCVLFKICPHSLASRQPQVVDSSEATLD